MRAVFQTDFSAARGNALQACFASIFDLELAEVPNFLEVASQSGVEYPYVIDDWLAPRGLAFAKIGLSPNGRLEFPAGPGLCVLAGPSPRGDFKHAVVARVVADLVAGEVPVMAPAAAAKAGASLGVRFEMLHDPHPDGGGLAGPAVWAGFFVLRAGG